MSFNQQKQWLFRNINANVWIEELTNATGLAWVASKINKDSYAQFSLDAPRAKGRNFLHMTIFDGSPGTLVSWDIPAIYQVPPVIPSHGHLNTYSDYSTLKTPTALLRDHPHRDLDALFARSPQLTGWRAETEEGLFERYANKVVRMAYEKPDLRPTLLPLLFKNSIALPRIPKSIFISPQDVKANLELYWSPLRNSLYPPMMGHGAAKSSKDIAEDIVWGFLFKTGNVFQHSPWRQQKATEFQKFVIQTMGAYAKTIAHNIALSIYNRSSGSDYWGTVFATQDLKNYVRQLRKPPQPDIAKAGITQTQMALVAEWLDGYIKDLKAWERKLDRYVATKVRPTLQKLIHQADQGIPPDLWRL